MKGGGNMAQSFYDFCIEKGELNLLAQWDKEKNGTLTPRDVAKYSKQKIWWICEKGHKWQAVLCSRSSGTGCPVCAGKAVLPGTNDLASQKPHIAAQWHPTKNGTLKPDQVTPASNREVWWLCEKGHEYCARVIHRVQHGSDCPYCCNKKVLAGYNDLATAAPQLAAQWHPDLNGEITPQMVTAGSKNKAWWICEEGHVWETVINNRAGKLKHGCPVCAGRLKVKSVERYTRIMAEQKAKK